MAGGGKRGKPSTGFRSLPTALGNRKKARFPHSHRRDGDIVVSNFKLQEANTGLPHAPHPFEIPSLPTPPRTECPHCARPALPTPNSEEAVFLALATIELESSSNVFSPQQAHRLGWKFSTTIRSKLDVRACNELSKYRAFYHDESRGWQSIHRACPVSRFFHRRRTRY